MLYCDEVIFDYVDQTYSVDNAYHTMTTLMAPSENTITWKKQPSGKVYKYLISLCKPIICNRNIACIQLRE